MKKSTVIIIILSMFIRCSSKTVTIDKNVLTEVDRLNRFFHMCEIDIKNAIKILYRSDIIRSLTHFQKIDPGGKKYYLLERKTISDMIRSVTIGVYSDLIVINSKGIIIYTMVNDDIFGHNVKTYLKESTIHKCFIRSIKEDIYIHDISIFPLITGNAKLFISMRNGDGKSFRGVLILQIDIMTIEKILQKNTTVIGRDGNYRIVSDRHNILCSYPLFNKIDLSNISKSKTNQFEHQNKIFTYYPFKFKNLSWIVITDYRGAR